MLVGLHHHLHPGAEVVSELVEAHKDQIESVKVVFNWPKNPCDLTDRRNYDKTTGGVMIDLGIYVF